MGGAAALEGSLGEPERGRDRRCAPIPGGQIQGMPEYSVRVRVHLFPQALHQAVYPPDINAPEDRRVNDVNLVVHIGAETLYKGDTGDGRRPLAPGTRCIADEGRCGPETGVQPIESPGRQPIGAAKAGVDQCRRPGMAPTEFGEFLPTGREDHRSDYAGRVPQAKDQQDSCAEPGAGLQGEERGGRLHDQIRAVSDSAV